MDTLLIILIVILSILGLVDLLRRITFYILQPPKHQKIHMLVHPKNAEECEFLIRSAAERAKWSNLSNSCQIICINEESNSEVQDICARLTIEIPYLVVSNLDNLRYNIN